VESQEQSEGEICRVIVMGRDRTEVLLKTAESGFAFPAVEVPRWERLAENVTAALRRDWDCDAVCLFTLDHSSEDGAHCEVVECLCDRGCKQETVWKSIHSLNADSFQNEAQFQILEHCVHQLHRYERDPDSPFARKGWLDELRCWTAEVIRPMGLELTGPFCQYNATPSFSLIRFETNGPAVWFKAVGEPNQREFPITLKLAELFPKFVPQILGTKQEWNGWLACEVHGTNLGETKDISLWEQAATELGRLQIESISESQSVLQSGAHDLVANRLLTAIDPFFDVIARLMEEQPKVPPAILNRDELSLVKLRIEDALTLLEDLRIPDTLGHLDLNPWNVIASGNGCVFVDWVEAYVGSPFFSFQYLLEHFRRAIGANPTFEFQLVQAYRATWARSFSDEVIREGLALALLPAVFAYATGTDSWKDEERLRDPKIAGYFRSLARRMNREAIQFIERRSPCLS
jgi:hypothetical protein